MGAQNTQHVVTLEDALLALGLNACQPRRAGPAAWRAECPVCRAADAIGLSVGFGGLAIAPRCGCTRAAVLAALGLGGER